LVCYNLLLSILFVLFLSASNNEKTTDSVKFSFLRVVFETAFSFSLVPGRRQRSRELVRLTMEIRAHNTNNVIILWTSHPRSGAVEEALNLANKSELGPLKQHGNGNVRAFDENIKIYSRIHTQRFRRCLQSCECIYSIHNMYIEYIYIYNIYICVCVCVFIYDLYNMQRVGVQNIYRVIYRTSSPIYCHLNILRFKL